MMAKYGGYAKYGAAAMGYGAASRYAPGTTTTATMGAGAFMGYNAAMSDVGTRVSKRYAAKASSKMGGGKFASGWRSPARLTRMRGIGGGIAGAIGGYAIARASRALFGPSVKSNKGYR